MPRFKSFSLLFVGSLVAAFLLACGLFNALQAAYPDGLSGGFSYHFFVHSRYDMVTHLLAYAFAAALVAGAWRGYLQWRKQRRGLVALTRNLGLDRTVDVKLPATPPELKGKISLIDRAGCFCFCSGLLSPRVHLSRGMVEMLTPPELEAVLLHEHYHLKNRDPLKILLGSLAVSALFFIPALKDVFQRYLLEKELAADRHAVVCQGHKRNLAGAMLKLTEEPAGLSGSVVSGAHLLGARIDYLTGDAPPRRRRITVPRLSISLLVLAFFLLAALFPLPTHLP